MIIGLDIGTTSISVVLLEEDGRCLEAASAPNAFLPADHSWAYLQDPLEIRKKTLALLDPLFDRHGKTVTALGITGQMHGILYLDGEGQPISPLIIWQDQRGNLPFREGMSYAAWLSEKTGHALASGYGMVSHFCNLQKGLVPENARYLCTVMDYIAMTLTENRIPCTDPTNAASLGLYDLDRDCFDEQALAIAGIQRDMLPRIQKGGWVGSFRQVPVAVPIGDNQASFFGASQGKRDCVLVNIGTGSQISIFSEHLLRCPGLETRPFPGGGFLLVGASLCGGRAYAILEKFFRAAAEITGFSGEYYGCLESFLSREPMPEDLPLFTTTFSGTRLRPEETGSITCLTDENFTPRHFAWGMMKGIVQELRDMYEAYQVSGGQEKAWVCGSGNALRKNTHFLGLILDAFGQSPLMTENQEEAAVGAAWFAAGQKGNIYE